MTPAIAAITYLGRGWSPIPCLPRTKHPLVEWKPFTTRRPTETEVRTWFRRWPMANVALICGSASGLVAVDLDPRNGHGGMALLPRLPRTVTVETGGGGRHLYFCPSTATRIPKIGRLLEGVDVQGESSCITAPPSVHPSGRSYRFASGLGPDEAPVATLPPLILDLIAMRRRRHVHPVGPREPFDGELTLERVLARLADVRRSGQQWTARCPAHDDREPSLSIASSTTGRVLLYCHAGCAFAEIRLALRDGVTA
jgi:hypothetical protein